MSCAPGCGEVWAVSSRPVFTFRAPDADARERLRAALLAAGGREVNAGPYEAWRIEVQEGAGRVFTVAYTSGKGQVTSGGAAHDRAVAAVRSVLGDAPAPPPRRASKPRRDLAPIPEGPHIGTDEAGKGDYFGPLVSAAVFADEWTAEALRQIGVRDSKTLTDAQVRGLAAEIRRLAKHKVTRINPARYNALYETFVSEGKNLNSLLAWGHVRSVGDLLDADVRPAFVLADQFGDPRYIERRLGARLKELGVDLVQRPKAEEDVAVAAASILARDEFLRWLARESRTLGMRLPKGAGPPVIAAGRQIVQTFGSEKLAEVAKLHFKTTASVLG